MSIIVKYTIILLFVSNYLYPQTVKFKNIGLEKQLPSCEIYSIIQDAKGYVWCSTDVGVFRYNGNEFKHYTTKDGLPDNTIFCLKEDKIGKIWMYSYNNKICYYKDGNFHQIEANDSLSKMLTKTSKLIMSLDINEEGDLYVGSFLIPFKISHKDNYKKITSETHFPSSIHGIVQQTSSDGISSSHYGINYPDEKNVFYGKGFYSIKIKIKTDEIDTIVEIRKNSKVRYNPHQHSIKTKKGDIVFSYLDELYVINKEKKIKKIEFRQWITNLYEDNFGNLWVSFYNDGVKCFLNSDISKKPKHYFEAQTVTGILNDYENGYWVTTTQNGLYYSPTLNVEDYSFYNGLDEKIVAVTEWENSIIVANSKNQLFKIKSDTIILNNYYTKEIPFETEYFDFKKYGQKLFVASFCIGEFSDALIVKNIVKSNSGFPYSGRAMAIINENEYWALSTSAELYRVKNNIVTEKHILPSRGFYMISDRNDKLLIGTNTGMYYFEKGKFTEIPDSILKTRITFIAKDKDNIIYVCTRGNGLLILIDNKWIKVGEKDGLNNLFCNNIDFDNNGYPWIATNDGISKIIIDRKKKQIERIENLTISDGLLAREIKKIKFDGDKIWVGSKEGLFVVNNPNKLINNIKSKIYLAEIFNNNLLIDQNKKEFAHNSNNFTFRIDNLCYKDFGKSKFLYRLKGYTSDFKLSKFSLIEFQNLKPGDYELEVCSINNNGIISLPIALYDFKIAAPFWSTWWFYISLVTFIGVCIYIYIKWRIDSEKEKIEVYKKLIESQLTALRAQMNPHFIFNAITGIQRFVLTDNKFEAYDYLQKFSSLIRQVLNNSNLNQVTLKNELETLKLYVEIEQMRFEKQFSFNVDVAKDIDQDGILVPCLIIQPFVENSIWHGIMPLDNLREGLINITIRKERNLLFVTVEDNGIGREESRKIRKSVNHTSMGINLVKQRLDLLKNSPELNSQTVIINDLISETGSSVGTRVELVINLES